MEIAARRSKICAHRKEDDGTRVHVETFVRCMHTSGVTNGFEYSAKLKIREDRRKRGGKREGRKVKTRENGNKKQKGKEGKMKSKKYKEEY